MTEPGAWGSRSAAGTCCMRPSSQAEGSPPLGAGAAVAARAMSSGRPRRASPVWTAGAGAGTAGAMAGTCPAAKAGAGAGAGAGDSMCRVIDSRTAEN